MESAVPGKGSPPGGLDQGFAGVYWLVTRHTAGVQHALLVDPPGGEAVLPVFSDHPEAETFVWLGGLGGGEEPWQPRRTTSGELLAMLIGPRGPRATVGRVALDPQPELLLSPEEAGEVDLRCWTRKGFVERLLAERQRAGSGESVRSARL